MLLTEYLQPGAVARLNIVPPSNDRILSSVNLAAPDLLRKGWRHVLSEQNGGAGALQTHADLTVRAHLTPGDPHSFVAFVAGANQVRSRAPRHPRDTTLRQMPNIRTDS